MATVAQEKYPAVSSFGFGKDSLANSSSTSLESQVDFAQANESHVRDALQAEIQRREEDSGCDEDAFFVSSLGLVKHQIAKWHKNLPRVKPFYAVKCNGDAEVLKLMVQAGLGFDCASKREIEVMLGLGVSPESIVYANPCKAPSHVTYAKTHGVKLMTFDNMEELVKCSKYYPDAELLLRLETDDSSAVCQLSNKYGSSMSQVDALLSLARDLRLKVVGVAFHVGSGSSDASVFVDSLRNSRLVFEKARALGFDMKVLDIGGGFEDETLEATAKVVNHGLQEYFSEAAEPGLKIISEPGRYFVANAFVLAANVIGRRGNMVYLNDGLYGNLNSVIYDHFVAVPKLLKSRGKVYGPGNDASMADSNDDVSDVSVWGPTCDGLDCITKSCALPWIPEVGDWVYFDNTGAYTLCASTKFNGFNTNCKVVYVV